MFLYFPFLFLCAPARELDEYVINIITIFPRERERERESFYLRGKPSTCG